MSPLAAPPDDLGGFPAHKLGADRILYRIHRSDRAACWFSDDVSGRFDLLRGDEGTCYLAERPVGAFVEVFRIGTVIPEAEVRVRFLSRLHPPATIKLADCTASEARGFGVTGAIHSQPDYALARAWAQAFADAASAASATASAMTRPARSSESRCSG